MSSTPCVLGPVGVRGMTVLEREKFMRTFRIPVIKVKEESLWETTKICKCYFLKVENFKPVQKSEDDDEFTKHIHLDPEKISQWTDITETNRSMMTELGVNDKNFFLKDVQLGYNNWSYSKIFKAVLPENEDFVSSFTNVGHIIHLNLRDHLLEFRFLIGQVLLDKMKLCRTVVTKSQIIDNTYRNFSMEVIAGEPDFFVEVKENNCIFQFDFSKVYWNSRLGKEHDRVLSILKPKDVVFDVFCGVGPFSIPAAKKKCKVYANDLNPDSYKWLNHNALKNKIKSNFVAYNLDGKEFICNVFKDFIIDCCKGGFTLEDTAKVHLIMNLPGMAVEFLKYFKGLVPEKELADKFKYEVIIYVYCFVFLHQEDAINGAKKLVNENFDCDMSPYILDVLKVRKVAPKKDIVRVTIKLSTDILFDTNCEPPAKRVCTENN